MNDKIKSILKELPLNPGVYIMYNESGRIIYVGKAKSLKKRVNQYFLPNRDAKTSALVSHIDNIEYIITGNEYEALILENNLIKKHKPKYNIDLKDGKTYQMIRVSNEDFPKVFKTRRLVNDGSLFFGPFPNGGVLDSYMSLLNSLFKIRRCGMPLKKRSTPCLYYHIGKCLAPCAGKISKADYNLIIQDCKKMLSGQTEDLRASLVKDMNALSREMKYEQAAEKRDLIKAIDIINAPQTAQNMRISDKSDYVAIESNGSVFAVAIMQLRDGYLLGKAIYRAETFASEEDVLTSFLLQYYNTSKDIPQTIYISEDVNRELIEQYFKEHLGDIKVEIPYDGKHYRALRMAEQNAKEDVEKRLKKEDNTEAVMELKEVLGLENPPRLIEGYDIAQLNGKYTVASLISFKDGKSNKQGYRRFNIKSLDGAIDDFGAIAEATFRRYRRVVEENLERPDLVLIDGGKGQVNIAREVLDNLGLADIPVIGLAKKQETIVFDYDREDLNLPHSNAALRLLIAIRDECHRFATTLNQRQRSSDVRFKLLCSIKGIGEKRARELMTEFDSLESILNTSASELSKRGNIPLRVAERLLKELSL